MNESFHASIMQQPAALRDLADHYSDHLPALEPLSPASPILLTGMGASLHAAQIMAYSLHAQGFPALCIEAADLLHFGLPLLNACPRIIFVSQSGASAEVQPIMARLPAGVQLLAVTNEPASPLAQGASLVFPLVAGVEKWVATKTYVNAVALLWLLARRLAGAEDGRASDTLRALADACQQLIAQEKDLIEQWFAALDQPDALVLLGHGPDSVTAHHSAMMLSEWSKRSAFSASIGGFRHGSIEQVKPGANVVCFASNAATYPLTQGLARELAGYGAKVVMVNGGRMRQPDEAPEFPFDPFLAPILDVIPAQLYVEALARRLGIAPGFRYIAKIVSKL